MIRFLALLFFLSWVSPINGSAASLCYDLYGNTVGPGFLACPSYGAKTSMCCALTRDIGPGENTDDSQTRDICLSNGLCQNIWTNNSSPDKSLVYHYYWDFCTSDNWSDGCLPDVCNVTDDGYGQLTPCADTPDTTKWCCGQNATDCCKAWPDHRLAVTLPLTLGLSTSTSTSSKTQTSSSSATTSATGAAAVQPSSSSGARASLPSPTSSSDTATSTPSAGLSTGAQAGIGIAAALVGLALLAGLVFLVRRAMQRRRAVEPEAGSPVYDAKIAPVFHANSVPVEVEAGQTRYELSAGNEPLMGHS